MVGISTIYDGVDMEILFCYGRKYVCSLRLSSDCVTSNALRSAWWINDRPRPPTPSLFETYYANVTLSDTSANKTANVTMVAFPVWRTLSSDIFTGQIIASLIVLTFLGIFLLREWILQNARPGVFEDEELLEGANELQPPQVLPVQDQPLQVEEEEAPPADPGALPHDVVEKVEDAGPSPDALLILDTDDVPSSKRRESSSESSDTMDEEEMGKVSAREVGLKRRHSREDGHIPDPRLRAWAEHLERNGGRASSSQLKGKERSLSEPIPSPSKEGGDSSKKDFAFTFTMERSPSPPVSTSGDPSAFSFASPSAHETLHTEWQSMPRSLPSDLTSSDVTGPSSLPRRPPLPSSSLPTPDKDETFVLISTPSRSSSLPSKVVDLSHQPLPSPPVTTYQAPEDLQREGDSAAIDYFDGADSSSSTAATAADSIRQEDVEYYFRDGSDDSDTGDDDDEGGFHQHNEQPMAVNPAGQEGGVVRDIPLVPFADIRDELEDADADADAINDDDVDGALEGVSDLDLPIVRRSEVA